MKRRDARSKVPAPKSNKKNTVTAAQVMAGAVRAYGRWVFRSPDTRGLANGLAVLYPLGEIGHQFATGPDALWIAGLAPPAAVAAWVGTYKAHGSPKYSATVAATAAGVPAWFATASYVGVFNLPALVAYSITAVAAWSGYTWSDVLKRRRAWKEEQANWDSIAGTAGLEHSHLVAAEDTRLGQRFKVDIRATGKTARQLIRGDLDERVAMVLGLGVDQVRVTDDRKHAGIIYINIQLIDPWASPVPHPLLDPDTPAAITSRRRRSIMDGPLVLGTDPDSGQDLTLTIFNKKGGWHTQILATNGGGKTVLLNNIVEQDTDRTDVLVMAIDLGKGTIPTVWGDALDARAGIDEEDKALQILTWCETVIKERSRKSGGVNHKPSPTAPVIQLIIDELDTLTGLDSPIGHKARPKMDTIYRRGRSAGVELVTAGQRLVVQHTGTKEGKANALNKIVLRVLDAAEMNHAVPDWETLKMPNMATYAPGVDGVALLVAPGVAWKAGRIRDMSDIDEDGGVRTIAAARSIPNAVRQGRTVATLEADIAAKLPGYHDRWAVPATTSGNNGGRGGTALIDRPAAGPVSSRRPSSSTLDRYNNDGGGFGVDPDDHDAINRLAETFVAEVEAALKGMPEPPDQPTSLADLINTKKVIDNAEHNTPEVNREIPIPPDVSGAVLDLLRQRGSDGARRNELIDAVGRPTSTVAKFLAIMKDQELIAAAGAGKAARYYLPEHAPTQNGDADSDTPGDDAE